MSTAARRLPGPATLADLLALPEEDRYEIVDGELVPKEAASGKHGGVQFSLGVALGRFRRRGGPPDRPGGWLFATEALIRFTPHQVRRPDVAGWRHERLPELPAEVPITLIPDWICEILSPSNAGTDTITKMRLYHQCQVPHYWLIDPLAETLTVLRWTREGYLHVLGAARDERVRAEPFAAAEIAVRTFFDADED
jgi:Uma2 family endonuclease